MPEMDGPELAGRIHSKPEFAGAHLVLLERKRGCNDPGVLRKAGVEALLTKPVRHSDLYNALLGLVSGTQETAKPAPSAVLHAAGTSARGRLQVLVAEDNPINQKVAHH